MSIPSSKTVCLITSGQPATNPRLVKEADALSQAGYEVTVVYAYWAAWAQEADRLVLFDKKWKAVQVGGSPTQNKTLWYWTRFRHKLAQSFPFLHGIKLRALCRPYDELLRAAKANKADLYIGHNLAALPVAVQAAKYHKSQSAFDIEDFHRAEEHQTDPRRQALKLLIETSYLPKVDALTAASPLIAENYQQLLPNLPRIRVILNTFPKAQQPTYRPTNEQALRLFWFSQTIGADRGLEDVLQAMERLPKIQLHLSLIGNVSEAVRWKLMDALGSPNHHIEFLGTVAPDKIFEIAAKQDVGLALERQTPFNRDICLTNKIFTYLLAGNAVLATATQAQQQLLKAYPGIGELYNHGDVETLAGHLENFAIDRISLEQTRRTAWQLAHDELNWETEQRPLLQMVQELL
ncbi:MAG: hypothetical protein KDC44_06215 [Phaeodactylibacter sp.]|nr:hypothetical protein [Phaeodactylibacter sp.]